MKKTHFAIPSALLAATVLAGAPAPARAQQAEAPQSDAAAAELAKKLANPIASLISVPVKWSWDEGIGPADGEQNTLIVQPVIPFSLNADWNLITRTIIPYVDLDSASSGGSGVRGLADILQSFFFSPKAATAGGWVWGAGPVFSYPTAEDQLGSGNWSAGPTVVLLKQQHGWTYGVLANHLWSVAEEEEGSAHTSASFVQPFLSFTTPRRTTWGLNTESTYNWRASQWTVPINASVSQLMRFGKQPVSLALAARVYADGPPGGPDWGLSLTFTMLFPK